MLQVEGLNVHYGRIQVLHDISICVEAGKLISIVGANSAGKSSFINAISGLVKPTSGKIQFNGTDISRQEPHNIVKLGLVQVPEGRKLFPKMTVLENLLLGATLPETRPKRDDMQEKMCELFPWLRERFNQIASTLSGGEQQMLAIARAMMSQPRLLMLDEPSLGLAPLLVMEMFRVVQDLNRQGLTVLLVEQNIEHSLEICDYAYVLENGRIVLSGTGKELLENEYLKKAYLGL